ncbi:MAG: phage tail protein [Candidatus Marinimicrobia bacterium]|nr:phage tail protein [Candidatus Neomarinimicrobiota bacterium]
MAKFSVNTHRFDPYKNFKFQVRWDGKTVAGISKVSSLSRSTEPVTHREGGDPNSSRLTPSTWSFEPITLERGITHDPEFEDWANLIYSVEGDAAMSLKNFRKDVIIQLHNEQGTVVKAFKIYRCWVSEYQALPELDANANAVAIERVVLQNEGWERDESVTEPTEY